LFSSFCFHPVDGYFTIQRQMIKVPKSLPGPFLFFSKGKEESIKRFRKARWIETHAKSPLPFHSGPYDNPSSCEGRTDCP